MSTDINETLGVSQNPAQPDNSGADAKYNYLKKIAQFIAILGWVLGGVLFIAGIGLATSSGQYGRPGVSILVFLVYIFGAVVIVVSFLAQAGIMRVLIDIEENTRKK